MARLLVVYASQYGQTRKIADEIAAGLRGRGHGVEVVRAEEAGAVPIDSFDAIVAGAPVYRSRFPAEFEDWARLHSRTLSSKPAAFFSVCLGILQDPEAQVAERRIVTDFFARAGWNPPKWTIFAGALSYTKYGWLVRLMMRRIAQAAGGDTDTRRDHEYTDWDDVRAFAAEIHAMVGG